MVAVAAFFIDQVELAFARTSILVKYLLHLPAQPSAGRRGRFVDTSLQRLQR